MHASAAGLNRISLVCLPTLEQDDAIAFYEALGFHKRTDTPFGGGMRWIEMALPGDGAAIALAPPPPGRKVEPVNSGLTLECVDVDATHAALLARGVDVDAEVTRMGDPISPMFWFRDPSGHTLLVVEAPAA
ncbi:VOC family protein [Conexibacter sp. DBS9H8]|uniref:VOC family protein n=1 Tax=Conexibacter sp. DBS9H8 TaxID=2937801 RepID=UPI00200F1872|nr:VOC family protein [Conexibacter sp. DBS9H8]